MVYFEKYWEQLTRIAYKVVFFLYLWSIDMNSVLVSMSCFNPLCEEAEIHCGSDDATVTYLLPNYQVYQELTAASTILKTGKIIDLRRLRAWAEADTRCRPRCPKPAPPPPRWTTRRPSRSTASTAA
jgi:hypothetical protein